MPYFSWRAITLQGTVIVGKGYARSMVDLEHNLLIQDRALLTCKTVEFKSIFNPLSSQLKTDFFKDLAMLMRSGMYIDQALRLLASQASHKFLAILIKDLLMYVQEGSSFSQALSHYPLLFDVLTIQIMQASQESGKFVEGLEQLCSYYGTMNSFYKKLKGAAFIPCITLLFFFVIVGVIFLIIVPSFSHMLMAIQKDMSYSTQCMLAISSWMSSFKLLLYGALSFFVGYGVLFLWRTLDKNYKDSLIMRLPLINFFVQQTTIIYWLYSLGLLVSESVDIAQALVIVNGTITNKKLQEKYNKICSSVESGISLHHAMTESNLFLLPAVAVIQVGEESGCLGFVLSYAADIYKERMNKFCTYIATSVYPVLMVIIGILIGLLIFSIYIPILDISYQVA